MWETRAIKEKSPDRSGLFMIGLPITNSASNRPCGDGASGNSNGDDGSAARATSIHRRRYGQQWPLPKPAWPGWRQSTQHQSGPQELRLQQSSFDIPLWTHGDS